MEKEKHSVREIGRFLSVVIASVLFGSTLILSAAGPARASEWPLAANHDCPAASYYRA